ncbi:MAG: hypothetical protein U0441_33820 [Polyangiaceae bacterium]
MGLLSAPLLALGVSACGSPATTPVHAPGGPGGAPQAGPNAAPEAGEPNAPSGVTVRDAASGFQMTLRAGEKRVCRMVPAGEENPAACAGFNLDRFREAFAQKKPRGGQRVVSLAIVRFKGWNVITSVILQPGPINFNNPKARDAYVFGMREGVAEKNPNAFVHGDSESEPYSLVAIDGHTGVKVRVERVEADGTPSTSQLARWITYSFSGKVGVLMTSFVASAQHYAELSRFADASMNTVRMQLESEASKNFALLDL